VNRYFSGNPEVTISQIRQREPEWFALAEDAASYAGGLVYQLKVPRSDEKLSLVALLYRRIAGAFESVILLAERGMHTEGLTARRALLEALFILRAIFNKPELAKIFLKNDKHRLFNIFKNIQELSPEIRNALAPELTPDAIDKQLAELKVSIKDIRYMNPKRYAQEANLYDLYLTDYCFLSEAAHHAAKDMERLIIVDTNGDIDGFFWGAESNLPSELLSPSIEQMLLAAEITEVMFKIDKAEHLAKLQQRLNDMLELAGSMGSHSIDS
jgi:hypothetical protein